MLVAVKAAATTAVAHAPPTPASQGKTLVTAQVTVARHVANAAHKPHAHRAMTSHASRVMKCSARTHAAPVSIWETSATILMNASQPAMYQQASHHPVCLRAAVAVAVAAGAAIAAVVVAATSVAAARAQGVVVVVVVVGEILVAGFGADQLAA